MMNWIPSIFIVAGSVLIGHHFKSFAVEIGLFLISTGLLVGTAVLIAEAKEEES